jgi:aspartyl/asparaginyl-tRNA synthetase
MREFFQQKKGFVEVPSQSRRSILAACEDPKTISQYIFSGINWPLPQTGQMWLEKEMLDHPDLPGVFCISTSYRNEPNPIPGRHDKIFPMFEFESRGNVADMIQLELELLDFIGFDASLNRHPNINQRVHHGPFFTTYEEACTTLKTEFLEAEHEMLMQEQLSDVVFLTDFPLRSDPFWNMKQNGDHFNKVDVILFGMETIGSAERSTNVSEMRKNFYTISDGEYSNLLFNHFGRKRVEDELEEYFSLDMFPRFGGGIGLTRICRALRLLNEMRV